MIIIVDRLLGALLLVGAALHAYGSLASYPLGSAALVGGAVAYLIVRARKRRQ